MLQRNGLVKPKLAPGGRVEHARDAVVNGLHGRGIVEHPLQEHVDVRREALGAQGVHAPSGRGAGGGEEGRRVRAVHDAARSVSTRVTI